MAAAMGLEDEAAWHGEEPPPGPLLHAVMPLGRTPPPGIGQDQKGVNLLDEVAHIFSVMSKSADAVLQGRGPDV